MQVATASRPARTAPLGLRSRSLAPSGVRVAAHQPPHHAAARGAPRRSRAASSTAASEATSSDSRDRGARLGDAFTLWLDQPGVPLREMARGAPQGRWEVVIGIQGLPAPTSAAERKGLRRPRPPRARGVRKWRRAPAAAAHDLPGDPPRPVIGEITGHGTADLDHLPVRGGRRPAIRRGALARGDKPPPYLRDRDQRRRRRRLLTESS